MAALTSSSNKKRQRPQEPKEAKAKAAESSDSSSESSDSDSEEDETENALFRPAAKSDEEESESESSESEDEPEQVKEKAAPAAKKQEPKKKTAPAKPELTEEDANLQAEIAQKTEATVYVEGIPYKADEGDLVSHFSSCGAVKEVRMPRYQDSGKPRGYAHVVFDNANSIPKALELDGKYLFGRYLTVRVAETPRTVELALKEKASVKKAVKGCRTIYIKQLPYDVEEPAIRAALESCGTITSVRLPVWNHTKKLKGFGYVEFSTEDEAMAAVKRSGMKVGGRMVLINLDVAGSGPKASFRQLDGQYWNKGEEAKKSLAKKQSEKQQRKGSAAGAAGPSKKQKR